MKQRAPGALCLLVCRTRFSLETRSIFLPLSDCRFAMKPVIRVKLLTSARLICLIAPWCASLSPIATLVQREKIGENICKTIVIITFEMFFSQTCAYDEWKVFSFVVHNVSIMKHSAETLRVFFQTIVISIDPTLLIRTLIWTIAWTLTMHSNDSPRAAQREQSVGSKHPCSTYNGIGASFKSAHPRH